MESGQLNFIVKSTGKTSFVARAARDFSDFPIIRGRFPTHNKSSYLQLFC
jgi:hypothetical protein